jgi:hypothetical protein
MNDRLPPSDGPEYDGRLAELQSARIMDEEPEDREEEEHGFPRLDDSHRIVYWPGERRPLFVARVCDHLPYANGEIAAVTFAVARIDSFEYRSDDLFILSASSYCECCINDAGTASFSFGQYISDEAPAEGDEWKATEYETDEEWEETRDGMILMEGWASIYAHCHLMARLFDEAFIEMGRSPPKPDGWD